LNDLVRVTPFVDLGNLVLVLLVEKISTLFFSANVHDEESNNIRSGGLWGGR
jgi:hypothetical protein